MKHLKYFIILPLLFLFTTCSALRIDHAYSDLSKTYPQSIKTEKQIVIFYEEPEVEYEEIGFSVIHGYFFAQNWRKQLRQKAVDMGGDALIVQKLGNTFLNLFKTATIIKFK